MNFFIPNDASFTEIAPQITHLGIGAHQDDLEIMALHGILECYENTTQHFGGIICASGSGSPRTGPYASFSDEKMKARRQEEQCQAALLGKYLCMIQLDHSSPEIKDLSDSPLIESLYNLLSQTRPQVIYTHNPLDKHPTHRAVFYSVITALRRLPQEQRPKQLLGGEVWRALDWLTPQDKLELNVSAHPDLSKKLLNVFDSQIAGGKRYDLAALGRLRANATYATPHQVDQTDLVSYAMDLTPLIENDHLDMSVYALGFVDRFRQEIIKELQ